MWDMLGGRGGDKLEVSSCERFKNPSLYVNMQIIDHIVLQKSKPNVKL